MLTCVLGAPNSGKTTYAASLAGALLLPVHFLVVAAHRARPVALYGVTPDHELLDPDLHRVVAGRLPRGETALVDALCNGETARHTPHADMALVERLVAAMRKRWAGEPIVAEGEVLGKPRWLAALNPDRLVVLAWSPERGCVRETRHDRRHPPADWTAERYLQAQLASLDTARRWLERGGP